MFDFAAIRLLLRTNSYIRIFFSFFFFLCMFILCQVFDFPRFFICLFFFVEGFAGILFRLTPLTNQPIAFESQYEVLSWSSYSASLFQRIVAKRAFFFYFV